MIHPLVSQLRFTRSEWRRGLKGVTADEAALDDAWTWWRAVTEAADPYLDTLSGTKLTRKWSRESSTETPGTKLHRTTYHYWFHLGESQAVRQLLGHTKLPDFVGSFRNAPYCPEP